MKNLFNNTIAKRWLILALFALLAIFGYYSWTRLAIEAYPDIGHVAYQLLTQAPA